MPYRSYQERRPRRSFCWGAALLLCWGGPLAAQALGPFRPLPLDDGPTVVLRPGLGVPLVTIRLSLDVDDWEIPGAARVLAALSEPGLRRDVAVAGGAVTVERRGTQTVYGATGPARSFDVLAAALRAAVLDPPFTTQDLRRARGQAEAEIRAELERPEPRVRALLRQRLSPGVSGTDDETTVPDELTLEQVRHLWSEQYRPRRMHVLVVGDLPEPVLRSGFSRWEDPAVRGSPGEAAGGSGARPEPQVLYPWAGLGYRLPPVEPAVAAVAAELVRERVMASALHRGTAEVWWRDDGHALVVIGSAPQDDDAIAVAAAAAPTMRVGQGGEPVRTSDLVVYLRRMVAEAAALLGPRRARDAALRLGAELRYEARTGRGLAAVAGALHDATGRYDAAQDLLDGLDAVDTRAVAALLQELLDALPVYAEVRP